MITPVVSALLAAGVVSAQSVFTVNVGQSGFTFSPSTVNVSQNDIIQFVFAPGHSVTQSDLADPCTPLSGGFNSGLATSDGEVWNLTVTTTDPIYYFCAQTSPAVHCNEGMVGAINVAADQFSSFSAAAKTATPPGSVAVALSGSGAAATASLTSAPVVSGTSVASSSGSGSGSGSGASSTGSGSGSSSSSTSAALPLTPATGLFASLLTLVGAAFL